MSDLVTQLENFRNAIQLHGEQYDGKSGSKGGLMESGDTHESTTWPKDVQIIDSEGEGTIKYPYDYRVREKHYMGGFETSTEDFNRSGMISANYAISRSGKVFVADIKFETPQDRDCGNCIVNRLQSMNGQTV